MRIFVAARACGRECGRVSTLLRVMLAWRRCVCRVTAMRCAAMVGLGLLHAHTSRVFVRFSGQLRSKASPPCVHRYNALIIHGPPSGRKGSGVVEQAKCDLGAGGVSDAL